MRASSTTIGILCLIAGIAIFSVQDLILKLISGAYPLHEAMVLRSLTAFPCLLLITRLMDGTLRGLISATIVRLTRMPFFSDHGVLRNGAMMSL